MTNDGKRVHDLIVFLAVLAAGILLVLLGVSPGALATVTASLSGLYATWRGGGRHTP
ncbi:hypothetical protein [Streptomyces sp. UNOB3_S3]|uniref:hypothetical protein n=1 Tax=Streptomyces sp. UNOB3_S3 TaxID=2871682 RepID=UPI001E5405FF|nr:hypothetical protein [Streptomyces sp. UNOB3_S3]MCC3779007.1 hypothetical protein [Streptomyces sp. UNOB3_S3]